LNDGVAASVHPSSPLEFGWQQLKAKLFAGKRNKADSVDPDTLNHLDWYESTHFTKAYPGESAIRPASDFAARLARPNFDLGD
jgi:hypothetical protein